VPRSAPLLVAAWLMAIPVVATAADESRFREVCGSCHFDGSAEGGLAIDALLTRVPADGIPDAANRDTWMRVLRAIRTEVMPPAEEPHPTEEHRRALIAFITRDVLRLEAGQADPGPSVPRRLNRSEYRHTIRDLTGLSIEAVNDLPADDTSYGFDTVGATLGLSPLLVERYLEVAQEVGAAVAATARGQAPEPHRHRRDEVLARVFPLGLAPATEADRGPHLRGTIAAVAERAFRGPVPPTTITRLVAIAEASVDVPGAGFEDAVAASLTAMLASPRFLFIAADHSGDRASGDPTPVPISDVALASRLSFFLWSSMPDDELRTLAEAGRLHDNLSQQVDRMLADPKADRFVADFVGQWLQTRDVETMPVDPRRIFRGRERFMAEQLFPPGVRHAMRRETEMVFARLVRDNLPATDLIAGRDTFLNESLARLYGVADVSGPEMRLVSLPDGSHRGGLLSHGSFLIVTSTPTRTSPVKRGKFILTNLLGTPAPPPPPNVPPLEEPMRRQEVRPTMRQLMEQHRADPLCAGCHARMDPLGLALESFDAIGRWRDDAESLDTSGSLITGEPFANAEELAALIAGPRRQDFHRCLAEKLLTYAIGRGLEYFDDPTVNTMVERMDRDGGGLGTLVHAVTESVPFRMRRPSLTAVEPIP